MKNSVILLAVALTLVAFAGMMRVKTDVQTMDRERLKMVLERAKLRETKRVLEAEWALLVSPERLQKMIANRDYVPASALNIQSLYLPVEPVVPPTPVSPTVAAHDAADKVSATAPISWPQ